MDQTLNYSKIIEEIKNELENKFNQRFSPLVEKIIPIEKGQDYTIKIKRSMNKESTDYIFSHHSHRAHLDGFIKMIINEENSAFFQSLSKNENVGNTILIDSYGINLNDIPQESNIMIINPRNIEDLKKVNEFKYRENFISTYYKCGQYGLEGIINKICVYSNNGIRENKCYVYDKKGIIINKSDYETNIDENNEKHYLKVDTELYVFNIN